MDEAAKTSRTTIIACDTVLEEMMPLMSADMNYQRIGVGLHLYPEKLRQALQEAVDKASEAADTIVLGYGLCAMAVVGLKSDKAVLVVPRVDDCIAIFLGSGEAYKKQASEEPGTYYLTKGWIEAGDSPFSDHERLVEKYDEKRADRMTKLTLKHYTRLAYIDTGRDEQQEYRNYSRQNAGKFDLKYDEVSGSTDLVKKMLYGPWDDDFVVVQPGHIISYDDFKATGSSVCISPQARSRTKRSDR